MTDADRRAAEDLASEMTWTQAAQFLRAEIGFTLSEANYLTHRIATRSPSSNLAMSLKQRETRFSI